MTRALLLLLVFAVPGCQLTGVRAPAAVWSPGGLAAQILPEARSAGPRVGLAQAPRGLAGGGGSARSSLWMQAGGGRHQLAPTCMQMGLGLDGPAVLVLCGAVLLAAPFWLLQKIVLAPLELLRR